MNRKPNIYKSKVIARYIGLSLLSKQMTVSPLKLQKLLYYSQAWSMVFFGREYCLLDEIPQAWVNGPVYPSVYFDWKDKNMCDNLTPEDFGTTESDVVACFQNFSETVGFTQEEIDLLEQIVLKYGSKTQNHLIFLTHSELPWSEMREGFKPYERSAKELSLDTMYKYYFDRHQKNLENRLHKDQL